MRGNVEITIAYGMRFKAQIHTLPLRIAASCVCRANSVPAEYRADALRWIVGVVECRELLLWCVRRARSGNLPKCLRARKVVLTKTSVDFDKFMSRNDVVPIPEYVRDLISTKDLKFKYAIPLFDKFAGSFVFGDIEQHSLMGVRGPCTPAFYIAETGASWSLYYHNSLRTNEFVFIKRGKGAIKENTNRILDAARQFVSDCMLGERYDEIDNVINASVFVARTVPYTDEEHRLMYVKAIE